MAADGVVLPFERSEPAFSRTLAAEMALAEVLLRVAQRHREGRPLVAEAKRELVAAKGEAERRRAAGAWSLALPAEAREALAVPFAQDIMSLCLFPHLRPSLAYVLQGLGQGSGEAAMTEGLMAEMLALGADEEPLLHAALAPTSPLVTCRLVRIEGEGPTRRVHPGPRLVRAALGGDGLAALPSGVRPVAPVSQAGRLTVRPRIETQLAELAALAGHLERLRAAGATDVPGGPAALFTGGPGTGKSFAARCLATRLERPLFQIDLGAVMSKWVGETEKNLSRIFERLSGLLGVILIDEADALLGKRVAVKEGRDAAANLLVSHLLSLLEAHEGLVILTTNLRANIDDAYIRRFAVVIEFTRPDAELRRAMWRDALSGAPLAMDLDALASLAAKVDLSGAEIRNIAHLAAAVAAEEGQPISPAHLARATLREKTKTTLTFSRRDLRGLAPFAEDEA
jgi:hypothetical protein